MKNSSLFLSYGRRDARWAQQFAEALRGDGITVRHASDMPSGSNWQSWLRDAIAGSDALVAVLSPEAGQSPWTLFEMGAADASGKPIIPIVSGDRPPELPLIRTRVSVPRSSPRETARRLVEDLAAAEDVRLAGHALAR